MMCEQKTKSMKFICSEMYQTCSIFIEVMNYLAHTSIDFFIICVIHELCMPLEVLPTLLIVRIKQIMALLCWRVAPGSQSNLIVVLQNGKLIEGNNSIRRVLQQICRMFANKTIF